MTLTVIKGEVKGLRVQTLIKLESTELEWANILYTAYHIKFRTEYSKAILRRNMKILLEKTLLSVPPTFL